MIIQSVLLLSVNTTDRKSGLSIGAIFTHGELGYTTLDTTNALINKSKYNIHI